MQIIGKDYRTSSPIAVRIEQGRIASIEPLTDAPANLPWIAPAFVDVQINGCLGHSFNSSDLTIESVSIIVDECRKHGIGALCPTLVTNSYEAFHHGFTTLRKACEGDRRLAARLPGFHLEGPHLSPEDGPRGAHPREHIRKPDWDEFQRLQEAAGGRIVMVTISPEYDESLSFIEKLVRANIVAAIGHTAATPARIREAVAAGAKISTHLGNGSHAQIPRHENYIWEQLAADKLFASVITDGHHLPSSVVKCLIRVKTPSRVVLTCDASSLAGLPPGIYALWGQQFEVSGTGRVSVPGTPFLAGSGVFTDVCVGRVVEMADVTLQDAVEMATERPRELLGLPSRRLEVGHETELVLFDWCRGSELVVRELVGGID